MSEPTTNLPPPPQPAKPFSNPYEGCDKRGRTHKLVSVIPEDDFNFIYSIRPTKGTLQTVINILWKKLKHELQLANITGFSQQGEFEQFISECRVVDGRSDRRGSPVSRPLSTSVTSNDRKRTPRRTKPDTNATNQQSDLSE